MVAPITDDGNTIRNLLPSISTDLVSTQLQGSRLGEALERARNLLNGQPQDSQHSILLISDGDFAEPDLERQVADLAAEGISLHVLGVGTTGGGPVPGRQGRFLTDNRRQTVESRLDESGLQRLAASGQGEYITADYRDEDTGRILKLAIAGGQASAADDERIKIWNDTFYWLLLPAMLAMLGGFRKYRQLESEGQP